RTQFIRSILKKDIHSRKARRGQEPHRESPSTARIRAPMLGQDSDGGFTRTPRQKLRRGPPARYGAPFPTTFRLPLYCLTAAGQMDDFPDAASPLIAHHAFAQVVLAVVGDQLEMLETSKVRTRRRTWNRADLTDVRCGDNGWVSGSDDSNLTPVAE